jgi:isopenicillin-N epimerase
VSPGVAAGLGWFPARGAGTPYDLRVSTPEPPQSLPGARLLFALDQSVAHLDHAAFGATPLPVRRAQQRIRDEMDANPARFFGPALAERLTHTRGHLAGFLGAEPEACAFVGNVDAGVAAVLRSVRLRAGDEVVTTDHGSARIALAVDSACAEAGAKHLVVDVPLGAPSTEVVHAVRAALTGRTRLVVVDQVTLPTARLFPVSDLVRVVHDSAAAVLVDAAGAPANVPTKVAALGADFWLGTLDTWAFAAYPCALLAVAEAWRDRLGPVLDRFGSAGGRLGSAITAQDGAAGLPLTLEPGGAADVVGRALGLDSASLPPSGGAVELPMRIVPLPAGVAVDQDTARSLRARIAAELATEVGITAWRGRGLMRLSAQVYNRAEEYDRLADRLASLLRRVARP